MSEVGSAFEQETFTLGEEEEVVVTNMNLATCDRSSVFVCFKLDLLAGCVIERLGALTLLSEGKWVSVVTTGTGPPVFVVNV